MYRWAHNRQKFKTLDDLKSRLFVQFKPTYEGSICVQFLTVKQGGTIADYWKKFETYLALLSHLTDNVLENTFLDGLPPVIRAEMIIRNLLYYSEEVV